jgi:NAD(P)-dependent dehydrogenase (short-subunit alcohol dehydrogenase family)
MIPIALGDSRLGTDQIVRAPGQQRHRRTIRSQPMCAAPFLLAKAVWPHMRRAGGGTIINVSSVAGRRGWANAAAYCATKFALTGLTQSLAAEGRPHGIRACVVYPGAMATAWGVWDLAQRESSVGSDLSANEALPAGEVADLIAWIAAAPANLVLNEATVTPLLEQGWP